MVLALWLLAQAILEESKKDEIVFSWLRGTGVTMLIDIYAETRALFSWDIWLRIITSLLDKAGKH